MSTTTASHDGRASDAAVIAGYLGSGDGVDRAMASFAETDADPHGTGYAALRHAVDAGRLAVGTGL